MTREVASLVSVVVPVFNVGRALDFCVESILEQTHPHLQVILVDDGSTDGSGETCDSWARHDRRVTVIHQDNAGLSAARNAGLAAATGTHLTFVDSDDWLHPEFVSRSLTLMAQADADIAVCHHLRTPDNAHAALTPVDEPAVVRTLAADEALLEFLRPEPQVMTVAWGKLFRRSLLEGRRFPSVPHEDEFVTYRILHAARRIVLTTECLYFYRQRAGSFMASEFSTASRMIRLRALRERAEYFESVGLGTVAYRPLLDEQLALWADIERLGDDDVRASFRDGMRHSVRKLRSTRQPARFRGLIEAHLLMPSVADTVYRIYLRRRARGDGRLTAEPR